MTLNAPQPTPDNTTQFFGLLVAALTLIAAVVNRLPVRKKKDTGEHRALRMIEDQDEKISDLETKLGIRDDAIKKAEDELKLLRPLQNEVENLRETNAGLLKYNELLAKELEDLRKRMDLS